jgi:hypothetical protein
MGDRVACHVHSWSGETDAGLHPATGGDGSTGLLGGHAAGGAGRVCWRDDDRSRHGRGVKFQSRRVIAESHWDAVGTRYNASIN